MKRKKYESPKIIIVLSYIEEGIAAGSAKVSPGDVSENVIIEWEEGEDEGGEFIW